MNAIKKILVPVDFSANSQKILHTAAEFAEKFGAGLEVVFVVQSFEDYSGFFVPHMPIAQFEEEIVKGATDRMKSFIAETLAGGVVPCLGTVLHGDIAEEIRKHTEKEKIDLIIMGTHGYKGLESILFGSVAEKVVKTAPCPVLTINPYR